MYTKLLQNISDSKTGILDAILRQKYNITDKVDIEPVKEGILIKKSMYKPREGWEEAFAKMDKSMEEESFPDIFENDDTSWWDWK